MKRKLFLLGVMSSAVASMTIGVISLSSEFQKSEAYDTSALPSTINLNRVDETDIRSYYSEMKDISGSEEILAALKTLLKRDQKYYSYDSGESTWKMLEIIDRDWNLSPASEITNGDYDQITGIITDYVYGNNDNVRDNPYIHSLYMNRDVPNTKRVWGSHGQRNNPDTIEREHIWPKSHGFDENGRGGARGDPMHLWSADGYVNGIHSNDYYGYVDKNKPYTDCGSKFSSTKYNYSGISKTLGTGKVFEPQDSDKGDIARACFYMASRYNNASGTDNTIDQNNPNLILNDTITTVGGLSTPSQPFSLGILSDLLEWNKIDPVDDYEIYRNDLLFRNYTNNRNPFIDFPQWADYIWGDLKGSTLNPTSDKLHDSDDDTVTLLLSNRSISITDLDTATLNAKATDGNTYTVNWESQNTNIVAISSSTSATEQNITLTPTGIGTTYVEASIEVGDLTVNAVCEVTIKDHTEFDNIYCDIVKEDYASSADPTVVGDIYKDIKNTKDLQVEYTGIKTKKEESSTSEYAYTMYTKNLGHCYNISAPSGYYPSNVEIFFNGNSSAMGKVSVRYDDEIINTIDENPNTLVVPGGSVSFANDDSTNIFWNFSTGTSNVQIKNITVKYTKIDAEVTFDQSSLYGYPNFQDNVSINYKNFGSVTPTCKWESNDTSVCTVSGNGATATVNYVGIGSAQIECEVSNGLDTASALITVNVTERPRTLLRIEDYAGQYNFTAGDSFARRSIRAVYSDDTTTNITYDCLFSTPNMMTVGSQTVNVSYTENTTTMTTSYTINISEAPISGIYAVNPKVTYQYDEEFVEPTVLCVYRNRTYVNEVVVEEPSFSTFDPHEVGYQTITVSATIAGEIYEYEYTVEVLRIPLDHLEIRKAKYSYLVGEKYSNTTVYAVFQNDYRYYEEDVSDRVEVSGFTTDAPGIVTVTLSYTDGNSVARIDYAINVYEKTHVGFDYATQGYENADVLNVDTIKVGETDEVIITPDIGSNPNPDLMPKYYVNQTDGASARFYAGNTLTISSADGKENISGIRFVYGKNDGTNEILADKGQLEGNIWKPNLAQDGEYVSDVTFTIDGTSGQRRIKEIYVYYYTSNDFVEQFLNECTCNLYGDVPPTVDWDALATRFSALYGTDQGVIRTGEASKITNELSKMLSRYDFIVWKYGYEDFIGRDVIPNSSYFNSSLLVNNDGNVNDNLIIIICSVITGLAIGGYFLLKYKQR